MQAQGHSGCWGDNDTPIILPDNNKNVAFIGINWRIFSILPPDIES